MKNTSFRDKQVLITGASSGIGFELARSFLREGAKVIINGSDPEKLGGAAAALEKEFSVRPFEIAKDLAFPNAPRQIFDEITAENIKLDILVNNAGFGLSGEFRSMDLQKCVGMIDVNQKALMALTHLFLPAMIKQRWGRVLNVGSTAAFQAMPKGAVYGASKSFVLYFSEAIAEELKGTGVRVTCLCPGPTRTSFFDRHGYEISKFIRMNMMTSGQVAEIGMKALREGKALVVTGASNRFLRFIQFFVPRRLVTKIVSNFLK